MRAAWEGDIDVVCYSCGHGADVNVADTSGVTALMWAGSDGHIDIVNHLYTHGADVNAADIDGNTALMRAVRTGYLEVARFIAEHGPDVNSEDKYGVTALSRAAGAGDMGSVRIFIDHGANVNATGKNGTTVLMWAAERGHGEIVSLLCDHGANVNAADGEGVTVLARAVDEGHGNIIRHIIEHGADVNSADNNSVSVIVCAVEKRQYNAVRHLLGNGATLSASMELRSAVPILMQVAERGHLTVIRSLAYAGVDVDSSEDDRVTALMKTVANARIEVICFLTTHGADPIEPDNNRTTALMRAVRRGNNEIVRLLVQHGVDLTTMRASKQIGSALLQAAANRNVEVIRFLAECGADLNVIDYDGMTVVMGAVGKGHVEIVRCLAKNGADHNAINDSRLTALMRAVGNGGRAGVLRCLTECGADPNASNNVGWTALMQAAAYGNVKALRYQVDHGAGPNSTDNFGETALMVAARSNDVEATKYLVRSSANVDETNRKGETAFRLAVNCGYRDIQRILWPALPPSWPVSKMNAATALGTDRQLERGLIAPSELELRQYIDTGNAIGEYRAKWLDADVIVKFFLPDGSGSTIADQVQLWQQVRHPNVIKLYGACHGAGLQLFVSEFASRGSLSEFLRSRSSRSIMPWAYLYQAALGLEYMHERKILYGELRCSNILIGCDELAKLANFRLSGFPQSSSQTSSWAFVEAMRWQSPKLLNGEQLSLASDIYSLGMCIVEAATSNTSWSRRDKLVSAFHKSNWAPEIQGVGRQHEPPGLVDDALDLVQRVWSHDPDKRASITAIVNKLEQLVGREKAESERSFRPGFLAFLEEEIENHGSNYSDSQLAVTKEAYREAASHVGDELSATTKPDWFIPWYELEIVEWSCQGECGFGSVHHAKWLGSDVVVKQANVAADARSSHASSNSVLSLAASSTSSSVAAVDPATKAKRAEVMQMFQREADIWFELSRPHVVRLFGACHVGKPFFVCEYATNGTLVKYVRNHPTELWWLLHEAILDVLYLHARNIVHCDLKGNNIVVGSDEKAKVTDFGLSSIASHTDETRTQITGAWHWVAPECLLVKTHDRRLPRMSTH